MIMMTEAALHEARAYARQRADNGHAARVVGVRFALNAYTSADKRYRQFTGYAVETETYEGDPVTVLLDPNGEVDDLNACGYVFDDGGASVFLWVTGWDPSGRSVFLSPIPLNINPDGSPRMRADGHGQVNMGYWSLPPRRTYHVKVRRDV